MQWFSICLHQRAISPATCMWGMRVYALSQYHKYVVVLIPYKWLRCTMEVASHIYIYCSDKVFRRVFGPRVYLSVWPHVTGVWVGLIVRRGRIAGWTLEHLNRVYSLDCVTDPGETSVLAVATVPYLISRYWLSSCSIWSLDGVLCT